MRPEKFKEIHCVTYVGKLEGEEECPDLNCGDTFEVHYFDGAGGKPEQYLVKDSSPLFALAAIKDWSQFVAYDEDLNPMFGENVDD